MRKRALWKASTGRGRKRSNWVVWLHSQLVEEFDRLREAGLKFSQAMLRHLALAILKESSGEYVENYLEKDGKQIKDNITSRWEQTFMERHNIVARSQTGKLLVSPQKKVHIEKTVAHHLGKICRAVSSGNMREEDT